MSSTQDDMECPNCGAIARREQDNNTCEIYCYCPTCKWSNDDNIEDEEY